MPPKKNYNTWLKSRIPKEPRQSRHNRRNFEHGDDSDDHSSDGEVDNENDGVHGDENRSDSPSSGDATDQSSSNSSASPSHNSLSDQNAETLEAMHSDESEDSNSTSLCFDDEGRIVSSNQSSTEEETAHKINDAEQVPGKPKKREQLDAPLYQGLTTTKFECLLMCFHFMMRHGLTTVALKDLLELINSIFGEDVINTSEYLFERLFEGSFQMEFHFYCPSCKLYLGQSSDFDKDHRAVECPNPLCKNVCKIDEKLNGGHFFIYIPIAQQLRCLFENSPNVWELLKYRFTREKENDCICDIFDGSIYRKLSEEGEILSEAKNVSLTCNSDGSPVFKATHNSLWPIQFRVNELPPDERFSKWNTMVAVLYFGKTDPEMSTIFTPFIRETEQLFRDGFKWTDPQGNVVTTRVATLNCVFDSIARPKGQGTTQFNGYWGCNFCYHPGSILDGHRHPRFIIDPAPPISMTDQFEYRYQVKRKSPKDKDVIETFNVKDRSDEGIREEMKQVAVEGKEVRGVKTLSPFFPLYWFDLVFGFAVDWMHCVLIGVCKFVVNELLLNSANNNEEYYVGLKFNEINERLLNITPPSSVSWFPRSLKERAQWKANEWRMWLLYYSLPCLQGILKAPYLKHHCLLVTAISILLQDSISRSDLKSAGNFLMLYVRDFQKLYGEKNMSFNVHLLLHLPKCVEALGPLWSFSAFPFESGNGFLVRLVKGTRCVAQQIAKKYVMVACLPEIIPLYKVSEGTFEYCSKIMSYSLALVSVKINDVTLPGMPISVPLNAEEKRALRAAGCTETPLTFERLFKGGIKYHAACYKKQGEKSNDSFVQISDNKYVVLKRIIVSADRTVKALVRNINVERNHRVVTHSSGASAPYIRVCAPNVFGDLIDPS